MRTFKHVIWDWNGTLLDDAWLCVEITDGLLRRRHLEPLTPERYEQLFDFPVRVYYERLGFDLEAESFEALGSEFIREYHERRYECRLQEGAREALEAIARLGIGQSVLSAYHQESLEEIVAHLGVRDFFLELNGLNDHYASGKVEEGKAWIKRLGHTPSDVLLVGDTVHDFEVATGMGTHCTLIPSGHHPVDRLVACGVPVIRSFDELLLNLGAT